MFGVLSENVDGRATPGNAPKFLVRWLCQLRIGATHHLCRCGIARSACDVLQGVGSTEGEVLCGGSQEGLLNCTYGYW